MPDRQATSGATGSSEDYQPFSEVLLEPCGRTLREIVALGREVSL